MGQERLNHSMMLNVHNNSIDSVGLVEVANQLQVAMNIANIHVYMFDKF